MAPLTLRHLSGGTYVVPSPANVGVYVTDDKAVLIDAGGDDEAGRQLLRLLNERGWRLEAIVCTHSNADHIGGCAYLQKRTGCRIAATAVESAFIEEPLLEPSFLYGGYPGRELRSKFLMARAAHVSDVFAGEGPILDTGLDAFPLPGHYFGMIGVRTPDDVVFLADSLFSEAVIAKHPVFFLYDVGRHLETLEGLRRLRAACCVPSHAAPTSDISGLIAANRRRVEQTLEFLETRCAVVTSFDDLLAGICTACGIELDANQYVLVGSTLRSMLAYLAAQGRVEMRFEDARLLWVRTGAGDGAASG